MTIKCIIGAKNCFTNKVYLVLLYLMVNQVNFSWKSTRTLITFETLHVLVDCFYMSFHRTGRCKTWPHVGHGILAIFHFKIEFEFLFNVFCKDNNVQYEQFQLTFLTFCKLVEFMLLKLGNHEKWSIFLLFCQYFDFI